MIITMEAIPDAIDPAAVSYIILVDKYKYKPPANKEMPIKRIKTLIRIPGLFSGIVLFSISSPVEPDI